MKRLLIGASIIAVLAIAAVPAWRWWQADRVEQEHADRNETEVRVGLTRHPYEVYEAGPTLDRARLIRQGATGGMWMASGWYFMTVRDGARDLHYPVPILGYRLGPDRDGAFVVTVRPAPISDPPQARPDSPPFAFVPSGQFLIGDRANPRETHYVWVPAFFIGVFEVTNAEYRDFHVDSAGYSLDANWTDAGRAWKNRDRSEASALLRPEDAEYKRFGQPDQPVTSVTWFEAMAYCRWLTARVGARHWTYALPGDAEWEKAARGPDGFDYGLGAAISDAEIPLYNWKKNPDVPVTVIGWADTKRSFSHNRYGIYHASGNVAEWTASAFWPYSRQQPYSDDKRNNPELSERRTVRGGSWYSATTAPLNLPYRDAFQPWHRGRDVGFRVTARLVP
jgi:formylglycine-generating enzyme required for sulfatase activity